MEKAQFGIFGQERHRQSRIWFQYQTITTSPSIPVQIGIEDQQGERGVSYDHRSLADRSALVFSQYSNSAFIDHLTIKLIEDEAGAHTVVVNDPGFIRGTSVILTDRLPERDRLMEIALKGGASLLLSVVNPVLNTVVPGAGLMIGTVFLVVELGRYAAEQQAKGKLLNCNNTYAVAHATEDPGGKFASNATDANFGMVVYWVLTDNNDQPHNLKIIAELNYVEYNAYGDPVGSYTIPTEKELSLPGDAGNSISVPNVRQVSAISNSYSAFLGGIDDKDFYKVLMPAGVSSVYIQTILVKNASAPIFFDLDLYLYNSAGIFLGQSSGNSQGSEAIYVWPFEFPSKNIGRQQNQC
jgi:hypothetical protein